MMSIYEKILQAKAAGKKQLAVLIDPDKPEPGELSRLVKLCNNNKVDYLFVGGSLLTGGHLQNTILAIKSATDIPVIIFPGSHHQVEDSADGILLLSLISGRNPDLLIGQHVMAAPRLKQAGIEILPTGYILIESGRSTTVQYISNTFPIPRDKPEIAACTALAGEQLGLKLIFAEAGSGAETPVNEAMLTAISSQVNIPVITGGGIRTPEQAAKSCSAGADIVVVGNCLEKDPMLLNDLASAVHHTAVNRLA